MQNTASILKILLVVLVIFIIIGYTYYRTKDFISGPIITILSPVNGSTLSNTLIEIKGTAKNISYISINDRQIFTDEAGFFVEKLLLYPGYNIISIKASDKFERNIEKTLELIYKDETSKSDEVPLVSEEPKQKPQEIKTIIDNIDPSTFNQDTGKEEELLNSVELLN